MSLILHHAPRSRSTRILWLLEELGADYAVDLVDIRRGDGSGETDPRNPHPLRQVPALSHHGATIVESVLITLYLTDLFPEAGMAPTPEDGKRAAYLSWLGLYGGVLEPVVTARSRGEATQAQNEAYRELDRRWGEALERGPHLLGDQFSAVDILFGSLLQWYRAAMPEGAAYDDYVARVSARPALARAMLRDGGDEIS